MVCNGRWLEGCSWVQGQDQTANFTFVLRSCVGKPARMDGKGLCFIVLRLDAKLPHRPKKQHFLQIPWLQLKGPPLLILDSICSRIQSLLLQRHHHFPLQVSDHPCFQTC